jgi:spermidine synthase
MHIVSSGAYGKALVLDGKWQSCTGDEFLYHEPLVHPAMVLHAAPRNVLILGGGEGATAREVLRWKSVKRCVMIDIDGEVVEACKQHLPEMHQGAFDDPRLEVVVADALDYLDKSGADWDVVISDLSDPIEEGPSFQLFTKEYFERVKKVLSPCGVISVQAGPVAPANMMLHVRLVNTLKNVFQHVQSLTSSTVTYASPWGFALGRNDPIQAQPDIKHTDDILAQNSVSDLKMFDGTTMLGLFQVPRHIRTAIEKETTVYTLASPPRFFGKGVSGS